MIRNRRILKSEQRKILRVVALVKYLMKSARTTEEIAEEFSVSERTIYRYLNLMESLDIELDQDFNGRYFVADYSCPVCGGNKHLRNETANNHYKENQLQAEH
jgi:predicted transcriptional regulator